MTDMIMLHCTKRKIRVHSLVGGQSGFCGMGFFTELFARPRPDSESARLRRALCMLEAMSPSDCADIGVKPADFPRMAREMARRKTK
jgi:uncharacterized protein YjiS (DUF1127 family)